MPGRSGMILMRSMIMLLSGRLLLSLSPWTVKFLRLCNLTSGNDSQSEYYIAPHVVRLIQNLDKVHGTPHEE